MSSDCFHQVCPVAFTFHQVACFTNIPSMLMMLAELVNRETWGFFLLPDSVKQNWNENVHLFECWHPATSSAVLINSTPDVWGSGQNHDPSSETVAGCRVILLPVSKALFQTNMNTSKEALVILPFLMLNIETFASWIQPSLIADAMTSPPLP